MLNHTSLTSREAGWLPRPLHILPCGCAGFLLKLWRAFLFREGAKFKVQLEGGMSFLRRKAVSSPWSKQLSGCLRSLSGTWTSDRLSPHQAQQLERMPSPLHHSNRTTMRFMTSTTDTDETKTSAPSKSSKAPREEERHRDAEKEPLPEWPDGVNPHTGEKGGPKGPEPTRYGDWERKGRVSDF